jgi:hypothetical protein
METRLSTDTVKPSDRIAWWRDAICSTFVRLDLECDPRSPFRCELGIRRTEKFDLISVAGSAQRVSRSPRHVSEDPAESLIVMLQQEGDCVATQDGREIHLPARTLAFLDSRRPYSLRFPAAFRQTVVKVGPGVLEHRLGSLSAYTSRPVEPRSRPGRLARIALGELGREKRDNVALPLANIAFDLLGLALSEVGRSAASRHAWPRCGCIGRRRRSPRRCAIPSSRRRSSRRSRASRSACCSASSPPRARASRTASSSSACCAVTTRCGSRRRRHAPSPTFALSWGFADASHFARAFRRRFAQAPSEARRGRRPAEPPRRRMPRRPCSRRRVEVRLRAGSRRCSVVQSTGASARTARHPPAGLREHAMKSTQKVLNGHPAVKVAIVQTAPVFFDRQKTIDKACRKIEEAGREGAQIIVFSEAWIAGYPYWGEGWESRVGDWMDVGRASTTAR